jgi:hypothetical protein
MHKDFDNTAAFNFILENLKKFGFQDSTWGNDECASLSLLNKNGDPVIKIWIDWHSSKLRNNRKEFQINYQEETFICNSKNEVIDLAQELFINYKSTN